MISSGGVQSSMPHSTSSSNVTRVKESPKVVKEDEDDMLDRLARELEENDVDGDDDGRSEDPDEEMLNKQINSVMPKIGKLAPMPKGLEYSI